MSGQVAIARPVGKLRFGERAASPLQVAGRHHIDPRHIDLRHIDHWHIDPRGKLVVWYGETWGVNRPGAATSMQLGVEIHLHRDKPERVPRTRTGVSQASNLERLFEPELHYTSPPTVRQGNVRLRSCTPSATRRRAVNRAW